MHTRYVNVSKVLLYKVVGYVILVKNEVVSSTVDSSVEVDGIIVVVLKLVGVENLMKLLFLLFLAF